MRNLFRFTQLVNQKVNLFEFRNYVPEPVFLVTRFYSFSIKMDGHALATHNKVKMPINKYELVCEPLINNFQESSPIGILLDGPADLVSFPPP